MRTTNQILEVKVKHLINKSSTMIFVDIIVEEKNIFFEVMSAGGKLLGSSESVNALLLAVCNDRDYEIIEIKENA